MWNYVTILALRPPFSPVYSSFSDISYSDEHIVATNCRQVFLLLTFKIKTCFELRTELHWCQVSGLVSAELVADMY